MTSTNELSSGEGSNVVVLGGGNGTSHILQSLLPLYDEEIVASLYALVHMADDGGSTGRLRKQYEVGSMGDLTRCLLALSKLKGDIRGDKFLQALQYRFSSGDLDGHTLRNALLAALEITSDLDAAIATFARILQIPKYTGVVPTTLKALTQQAVIGDAKDAQILGEGQHFISWNVDLQRDKSLEPRDIRVRFAEENVPVNPRAEQVLQAATHVIVAPGHTYGTILPTLASLKLFGNLSDLLANKRLIVVMTLLTTPKQTQGWSGEDFVDVYESYLGRSIDVVVGNTGVTDVNLVEGQDWVRFNQKKHSYQLVLDDVLSTEHQEVQSGDTVPRAIVVHDEGNTSAILRSLIT